ncbi:major facilitator superfamily domain-containing protein [Scleroderma yunnanense]
MAIRKGLAGVSLIFACGTALFSDGYANGIIGSVLTRIYPPSAFGGTNYSNTLTSVAFAGTVLGMLLFGWISDKLGRKFGMMSAAAIVALFSALSAASTGVNHSVSGMLTMLCACRFLLGIGVGAEYPCGSVSASEQTEQDGIAKNAQHRWLVLATNTVLDFGFIVAAFVPLVLHWIFGPNHLRAVWRISLGLDCYKRNSMKTVRIPYGLVLKRYWKSLLGLSLAWFIYDFISYFNIYSSTITNNITGGNKSLTVVFGWTVVITGLIAQATIGFIMSGLYSSLTEHIAGFAVIYGIFQSFAQVGPGNCLGVIAAKSGPTAVRGQYYGVAAATGKVGAFVGTWGMYFALSSTLQSFGGSKSARGNTGPFWIASGLSLLSALVTLLLVRPLTHDGMKAEDEAFRLYLEKNGFDVSSMGVQGD